MKNILCVCFCEHLFSDLFIYKCIIIQYKWRISGFYARSVVSCCGECESEIAAVGLLLEWLNQMDLGAVTQPWCLSWKMKGLNGSRPTVLRVNTSPLLKVPSARGTCWRLEIFTGPVVSANAALWDKAAFSEHLTSHQNNRIQAGDGY